MPSGHNACMSATLRIGIDIGRRLTNFVVHSPSEGSLKTCKLLSTPHDPARF